jgi:hypothetical protein
MALSFPNVSRSYDASKQTVCFWGYDSAFEISFTVGREALQRVTDQPCGSETELLHAFEGNRSRIQQVATRSYARRRTNYLSLLPSDFGQPSPAACGRRVAAIIRPARRSPYLLESLRCSLLRHEVVTPSEIDEGLLGRGELLIRRGFVQGHRCQLPGVIRRASICVGSNGANSHARQLAEARRAPDDREGERRESLDRSDFSCGHAPS